MNSWLVPILYVNVSCVLRISERKENVKKIRRKRKPISTSVLYLLKTHLSLRGANPCHSRVGCIQCDVYLAPVAVLWRFPGGRRLAISLFLPFPPLPHHVSVCLSVSGRLPAQHPVHTHLRLTRSCLTLFPLLLFSPSQHNFPRKRPELLSPGFTCSPLLLPSCCLHQLLKLLFPHSRPLPCTPAVFGFIFVSASYQHSPCPPVSPLKTFCWFSCLRTCG